MVVYDLLCDNAHQFEGWFASPEAFADQDQAGHLSCPMCGSSSVHKQPSAPYVNTGTSSDHSQSVLANPELLENMRRKVLDFILQNTEDVGNRFAKEARAIHRKEVPERAIRGQASAAEAKELREEGVEVFALPAPALPKDKLH